MDNPSIHLMYKRYAIIINTLSDEMCIVQRTVVESVWTTIIIIIINTGPCIHAASYSTLAVPTRGDVTSGHDKWNIIIPDPWSLKINTTLLYSTS